jgi:hypothetical protein
MTLAGELTLQQGAFRRALQPVPVVYGPAGAAGVPAAA